MLINPSENIQLEDIQQLARMSLEELNTQWLKAGGATYTMKNYTPFSLIRKSRDGEYGSPLLPYIDKLPFIEVAMKGNLTLKKNAPYCSGNENLWTSPNFLDVDLITDPKLVVPQEGQFKLIPTFDFPIPLPLKQNGERSGVAAIYNPRTMLYQPWVMSHIGVGFTETEQPIFITTLSKNPVNEILETLKTINNQVVPFVIPVRPMALDLADFLQM